MGKKIEEKYQELSEIQYILIGFNGIGLTF